MMSRNKIIFSFAVLVILSMVPIATHAQTTRSETDNNNGWIMYFGNHKLSDRFGLHVEAQWRRHDIFSENQQLLLRGGFDFYLKNSSRFTVGYGYVDTHPYGEFGGANNFPEHRLWQQFTTSQALGRINLAHRYRLEQRWIGSAATGSMEDSRYENRMRYMVKATMNITKEWKTPLFLAAYDEIFVNFGKEVAYNIFDQNRLYGALGITISPTLKVELGYLYQLVQLRSLETSGVPRNRIENNYTLQIGIFSTLPFYGNRG